MEASPQRRRLRDQGGGERPIAAQGERESGVAQRRVPVGLHLAGGDRVVHYLASGVHDRGVGVLPPLVLLTLGGSAAVLEEPVAVEVAVALQPLQRAAGRGDVAAGWSAVRRQCRDRHGAQHGARGFLLLAGTARGDTVRGRVQEPECGVRHGAGVGFAA